MGKKVRFIFLLIIALSLSSSFFAIVYSNARYPVFYKAEILKASYAYQVEPDIVASLISVESSYRKDVVSDKGAVGLMQLLPSTANWLAMQLGKQNFSPEMLRDPQTNIELGTFYLNYLLNKFNNLDNAICAYNAGEGVVSSWLKISSISSDGQKLENIPYQETKNHLVKFKRALKQYKKKYKKFALKNQNIVVASYA